MLQIFQIPLQTLFLLLFLNRHSSVTLDRNARKHIKDKRKEEARALSAELQRCGGELPTGAVEERKIIQIRRR